MFHKCPSISSRANDPPSLHYDSWNQRGNKHSSRVKSVYKSAFYEKTVKTIFRLNAYSWFSDLFLTTHFVNAFLRSCDDVIKNKWSWMTGLSLHSDVTDQLQVEAWGAVWFPSYQNLMRSSTSRWLLDTPVGFSTFPLIKCYDFFTKT